jgi:hypothetical protein
MEENMNRRGIFALSLITLFVVFPLLDAVAQPKSLKEQLIGTWLFGSASDTRSDGTNVDRWGPNAKGMLVFDPTGRFIQTITRADLPKFAANRVDQGTAEENKAIMHGLIVLFGTYAVNEADKSLTLNIEGCSFPNLVGGAQKRTIGVLTADELKYTNPMTTTGARAEVTWKRAR